MGEGKHQTVQSHGNGPVDAIFNAIHKLVPHKAKLALYQVHAVTEGTDAQAEVSVRLEDDAVEGGRAVTARAADPDTLVASAKAYLSRSTSCSPSAGDCTRKWGLEVAPGVRRYGSDTLGVEPASTPVPVVSGFAPPAGMTAVEGTPLHRVKQSPLSTLRPNDGGDPSRRARHYVHCGRPFTPALSVMANVPAPPWT